MNRHSTRQNRPLCVAVAALLGLLATLAMVFEAAFGQSPDARPKTPSADIDRIARLQSVMDDDLRRLAELKAALAMPEGEFAKAEMALAELDQQRDVLADAIAAESNPSELARLRTEADELEKKWTLAKQRFDLAVEERDARRASVVALEQKIRKDRETLDALNNKDAAVPPVTIPSSAPPVSANPSPAANELGDPPMPPGTSPPAVRLGPNPFNVNATSQDQDAALPDELLDPNGLNVAPTPVPSTPGGTNSSANPPANGQAVPTLQPADSSNGDDASAANPPPVKPAQPSPNPVANALTGGMALGGMTDANPSAGEGASPAPPESKELVAAKRSVTVTNAAAKEAEEKATSIAERVLFLEESIRAERSLRDIARRKADNASEHLTALNEELEHKLELGEDVAALRQQEEDALGRLTEARAESRRLSTHLDELQTELSELRAEQVEALEEAQTKRNEADAAQRRFDTLKNPFAPQNLLQWLLDHGVNVLVILFAVGGFVWLARMGEARLISIMASRGRLGNREERENRAKTIVGVFRNAANILTIGGGAMMVLDECGVPIGPLIGGAAIIGLAVAFGAQSLIKDYFTGFMVLVEQQYMINDVIRVGDISGQVERITLRMTMLRDIEGRVHFVPHGQISTVTNFTHGWSRAVFEIGVAYKEDVDRVINVLVELGHELRSDPHYGRLILEDLTMLGVDGFGDSAVTLKFFIKTRPLQQWTVKREMLRRIKHRFDETGIEIPFPHRIVFHRNEPHPDETEHTPGEGPTTSRMEIRPPANGHATM